MPTLTPAHHDDGDGAPGLGRARFGPAAADPHAAVTALLSAACRTLSADDRRILYLRFHSGRTPREIGAELGVTEVQVSRQLVRILRRLRTSVGEAAA
ncbi:sigma factor-like helix-turn-helix DNA-binding protein [Jiangella rhizosphaerae]|nr:sigma factor-like helix-turn-helix DNA-binding protein [Jiangella rhizosphaerae]